MPWLEAGSALDWECPDGWRRAEDDGVAVCLPYPADGALDCPAGEAHFPGEAGCLSIGTPCSAGRFADASDLSAEGLLHVDVAAAAVGDGSAAAPFAGLAAALDQAESGDTILLAAGPYEVDRRWPDGVSVRGHCVADTSLTVAEGAPVDAVIDFLSHREPSRIESVRLGPADVGGIRVTFSGAPVQLRGVEIAEVVTDAGALVVGGGAQVVARGVRIRDVVAATDTTNTVRGAAGIRVSGLRSGLDLRRAVVERTHAFGVFLVGDLDATLADVVVREVRSRVSDGSLGIGLSAFAAARVTAERMLIERATTHGVLSQGVGSEAVLEDFVVRDSQPARGGVFGRGLTTGEGGRLVLRRALVERTREVAVLVGEDGEGVLEDVLIRDTTSSQLDGLGGRGVTVQGARLDVRRSVLLRNREAAITSGSASEVTLEDVTIRQTLPANRGTQPARVLNAQEESTLTITRCLFADNPSLGLSILDGTAAVIEDVVFRDIGLIDETPGSRSLNVARGAALELRRAVVERSREVGVLISGEGTTASLTDLVVRDSLSAAGTGEQGRGVNVQLGARVELRRSLITGSRTVGILVSGDAQATLEDVVVRDTQGQESDGAANSGVFVQSGARMELARGLIEDSRGGGLIVTGDGSVGTAEDLLVRDSRARELDGLFGWGIGAQDGGRVEVVRGRVESSVEMGIVAILDAEVELVDVAVSRVAEAPCGDDCPRDVSPGAALGAFSRATLSATGFALAGGATCGVQLAFEGEVDLESGEIRGHPVAVCLQTEGYDAERLRRDVRYRDNGADIQATAYPAPQALGGP